MLFLLAEDDRGRFEPRHHGVGLFGALQVLKVLLEVSPLPL